MSPAASPATSIVLASTTQGGHPILPQNVLWNFIGRRRRQHQQAC
jgi:hypothetical protein